MSEKFLRVAARESSGCAFMCVWVLVCPNDCSRILQEAMLRVVLWGLGRVNARLPVGCTEAGMLHVLRDIYVNFVMTAPFVNQVCTCTYTCRFVVRLLARTCAHMMA
jgi:hypothetical protein